MTAASGWHAAGTLESFNVDQSSYRRSNFRVDGDSRNHPIVVTSLVSARKITEGLFWYIWLNAVHAVAGFRIPLQSREQAAARLKALVGGSSFPEIPYVKACSMVSSAFFHSFAAVLDIRFG